MDFFWPCLSTSFLDPQTPGPSGQDGDLKTFRRRREAELKNGRVAMFATMGCSLARSGVAFRRRFGSVMPVDSGWIQLGMGQNLLKYQVEWDEDP